MGPDASVELMNTTEWWKCVLPWPGKAKWCDTHIAMAMLLGAEIQYQAVSAFDWDEAWVIEVEQDKLIASTSKVGVAIAFLKYKGVT